MRATPSLFRVLQVHAGARPRVHRSRRRARRRSEDHPEPWPLAAALWRRPDGDRPDIAPGLHRSALHDRRRDAARVLVLRPRLRRPCAHGERRRPILDSARLYGRTAIRGVAHAIRLLSGRPPAARRTVEQVRAQIDALNAENVQRFPDLQFAELGMYTAVTPLQDALTRSVRRILYLLWGGAAFVLLIGALNIANLALARASVRTPRAAPRVALGASRFRVTRQLIVEGVLLASLGGVAGLAVGHAMLQALASSGLADIPNGSAVQIDATVVFAILAAAILVGVR